MLRNYVPLLFRYFMLISTGITLVLSFEIGTASSLISLSYFINVGCMNFTGIT